uniref:DH domain-containing protein n=1 Tax=Ciona savignyi TaxID=51511 RepID=H2YWZ7_CIOSA
MQQVFMEPLQELQCEGYLLSVDLRSVFANLEELSKVSMNFCHTLLKVVEVSDRGKFGSANAILQAFDTFGSVMCPPYQRYCTAYGNSITYREEVKSNEDYGEFLKWCERNPKCKRLKLNDFLVAPMQHLVKYPLLLQKIAQYTSEPSQSSSIENTLQDVQDSLKALEGKVSWLSHFQLMQDLQNSITWPPVYELDTKTTLPESLRQALAQQPCRNLIGSPRRQLVLDGTLTVIESNRATEVYVL